MLELCIQFSAVSRLTLDPGMQRNDEWKRIEPSLGIVEGWEDDNCESKRLGTMP